MDIGRLGSLKSKLVDENLRNSVLKIERLSHKFEAFLINPEGALALGRLPHSCPPWRSRPKVARRYMSAFY